MIAEILQVFFGTIWGVFSTIITCLLEFLPELLEFKRIISVFTPVGMIALYLGVPTFLVYAIIFFVKRICRT